MNIELIKIPFDELDLHKHQDKNQIFLAQTLLYSTKVNLHFDKNKFLCILVVTKYHVWFKNQKKQSHIFSLPFQALICLLKCAHHPEIVFVTDAKFDNIRISASTQNRCNGLISAISYVFTKIFKIPQQLNIHYINSADLSYFQRKIQQKEKNGQLNLSRYKKVLCKYQQKFSGIGDIFGQQFFQKIILIKQIYSNEDHMIHIAQTNEQQFYYLHTISKDQERIEKLRNHQLIYARALQFKIQLFFQYLPQLLQQPNIQLNFLFQQLWNLYDDLQTRNVQAVLHFQLLCYDQKQMKIKLRESRYDFLLVQNNLKKILYQCYQQKKETKNANQFQFCVCQRSLKSKLYHICLLIYEFIYGKTLFFHEQPQMILYLKRNEKVQFPHYMKIQIDKHLKKFLKKGIQFDYQEPEQLIVQSEWIKNNKINIKF